MLEKRTELVAKKITEFLKGTDRYDKTIVFCEDIDHAEEPERSGQVKPPRTANVVDLHEVVVKRLDHAFHGGAVRSERVHVGDGKDLPGNCLSSAKRSPVLIQSASKTAATATEKPANSVEDADSPRR